MLRSSQFFCCDRCSLRRGGKDGGWHFRSRNIFKSMVLTRSSLDIVASDPRDKDSSCNPKEEVPHDEGYHVGRRNWQLNPIHRKLRAIAGVMGNVLEWYDFAVFGFFSDVIGRVFFPKDQSEDLSVMESFAVFGGAFLMRPIGGLLIGYVGDTSGRKKALEISIFLMALATTLMGCLPTYDQIGNPAILLLLIVRMLQGLSVGGQLMSSLVFTLEGRASNRWGLYGSFVMGAANIGTFLGGLVAYGLRLNLTEDELLRWGWRIPFLSGILISFCGIYLKYFCIEDEDTSRHNILPGTDSHPDSLEVRKSEINVETNDTLIVESDAIEEYNIPSDAGHSSTRSVDFHKSPRASNPLRLAFSRENQRSLVASAMVPLLWSGGFYLSFVWMAIFMEDLIDPTIPSAFLVNSFGILLLSIWFPLAGLLSDMVGRREIMTCGGVIFGCVGPFLVLMISNLGGDNIWIAILAQTGLGISLAMWGAPMCAWLVESFEPQARLTSVSIGYNVAQALAGGFSPFVATVLVDKLGAGASGVLFTILATLSFVGLWIIAPRHDYNRPSQEDDSDLVDAVEQESTAIS